MPTAQHSHITHNLSICFKAIESVCMRGQRGPVAQWTRHRPTEPGGAGLSLAGIIQTSLLRKDVTQKSGSVICCVVATKHCVSRWGRAAHPAQHHRKNGRERAEGEDNEEREESRSNTTFDNNGSIPRGFLHLLLSEQTEI